MISSLISFHTYSLTDFFSTLIWLVWWVHHGIDHGLTKYEAGCDTTAPPYWRTMWICVYIFYVSHQFNVIVWCLDQGFDPGLANWESDDLPTAPSEVVQGVISCIYTLCFWSSQFKASDRFKSHQLHLRNYACEPRPWRHNDVINGASKTLPSPHITSHLLTNI